VRAGLALAVAVLLAGAAVALAVTRDPSPEDAARSAAEGFLERYVADDGRAVRHDEGGDTVSEGQAYALLLAAATGDEERFEQVWSWTRAHLRRPDGMLAWRWAGGRVADRQPAADADLDAARALIVAARRFGEPRYRAEGRALGEAIERHSTTQVGGRTVLVAGPWARAGAFAAPSYWSPRAFAALGMRDLEASSRRLTLRLTEAGLPPDWAQVHDWGVVPAGPPGGGEPGYSYDAVRTPVRLAESCDPADHRLAARAWPRLRTRPGAPERALDGTPRSTIEHPSALAGAAAAAHAAGDRAAAARLLDRAGELDEHHPSYYGAAWVALTRTMLHTDELGSC
jgi:endo-1,4-beta-D-glucanase Y